MASVAWILAVATGWMADVMMVSDDVTAQELASADGQSLAVGNALASASPTSINTTMTDVLSIKIIIIEVFGVHTHFRTFVTNPFVSNQDGIMIAVGSMVELCRLGAHANCYKKRLTQSFE